MTVTMSPDLFMRCVRISGDFYGKDIRTKLIDELEQQTQFMSNTSEIHVASMLHVFAATLRECPENNENKRQHGAT